MRRELRARGREALWRSLSSAQRCIATLTMAAPAIAQTATHPKMIAAFSVAGRARSSPLSLA